MPPSTLPHASGHSEKVHVVGVTAGQSPRVQDLRMDSRRESKLNTRFAGVRDSYYGTSLLGCVPWQLMYPAPEPFRQGLRGYEERCQNIAGGAAGMSTETHSPMATQKSADYPKSTVRMAPAVPRDPGAEL